ncbi:hypothetical protein LPJ70_006288, partial [Coemansia sp. RSA 2708]
MLEKRPLDVASLHGSSSTGSVTPMRKSSLDDIDMFHGTLDKLDDPDLLLEQQPDIPLAIDQISPIPVLQLFRFATKLDIFLNLAGVAFSCASGVVTPVMIIVFSSLMGVIIEFQSRVAASDLESANQYLDERSRHFCLLFFILGIVMWVLSFGLNACWAISAENQGLRIRKLYYKSIMRQDIGWFDT